MKLFIAACLLAVSLAQTDCVAAPDSMWSDDKCVEKCDNPDRECPDTVKCEEKCSGCACNASKDKVVYGVDDRLDYYEWVEIHGENDRYSKIMRESIVGLYYSSILGSPDSNGVYHPSSSTLGNYQSLCSGERFIEQRTDAFCSGTLVDSMHVITAGHCLNNCWSVKFVFNYYITGYNGNTPIYQTITEDDVYGCSSVDSYNDGDVDYAWVTLDREVLPSTGHNPISSVQQEPVALESNRAIVMIGCPTGLPFKIDAGGLVRDGRSSYIDYFKATADAFGGNSGSGVFTKDDANMYGILVRGATDYSWQGGCYIVNVLSPNSAGEEITYAHHAVGSDYNPPPREPSFSPTMNPTAPSMDPTLQPTTPTMEPTREPTRAPVDALFILPDGTPCEINDAGCITDGPGFYGNYEECNFEVVRDGVLSVEQFDLEYNFDFLYVNDISFTGSGSGLHGLEVSVGDQIRFTTDSSVTDPGFIVCLKDPCDCPGGQGWSSTDIDCLIGSETDCTECTTLEQCFDNTCAASGCEDFDPNARCQCDSSCMEYGNCCEDYVEECTTLLRVEITPDDYPQETDWSVSDQDGTILAAGGGRSEPTDIPVHNGECVTFEITDSFGDGICCAYGSGFYTLSWVDPDGSVSLAVYGAGIFGYDESHLVCAPTSDGPCEDDDTALAAFAASSGRPSITDCSGAAFGCDMSVDVRFYCPVTCGTCGCVDDDAALADAARNAGFSQVTGCSQAASACGNDIVKELCPLTCNACN